MWRRRDYRCRVRALTVDPEITVQRSGRPPGSECTGCRALLSALVDEFGRAARSHEHSCRLSVVATPALLTVNREVCDGPCRLSTGRSMTALRVLWSRLIGVFGRRHRDGDLDADVRTHLAF